ncbi:ribonuclease H-like domain-containing protein [Tanacetum coccineum]
MELENSQNNALAKLPMLKLGEYEMWEIRIKQYFQIQDYALWEVIENGNSWVPIPVTATESGPSTGLKMTVPSTAEEKMAKKNDVKARSLLLMALPNEHQLTFDQYVDAQSMFAAIKARFGGNEATKKTQKALLKQQYENFNASSSESLDSIFNRLQKLVSRLAILGVVTPPEDLNVKFLRSLPSEWDTHVVVWMNKPDFDTMGLDDLYNNFKIVEQKVKRSAGANNDDKNLAFLTTSGASIYAFLSTQPQGSQLVHEDLEQLHDDDLEEMDLKWNMALLSMRARKFYQRTGRKIIIDGSNTAGYDKSKVECFNCHRMGHFARECRAPRSKDNRNWNQGSSTKAVKIEDASEKAMCAIDGAGFDWSDMAEEEIQANMALMAFSDSEVTNDKSCSKSCLKNYEALKKQYDDLLVKLDDTGFKAATYKRGLATLEEQIIKYREHEVLFSEEIALLKRSVGHKEYQMGLLRDELEKITDKSKKGFGYNDVPSPHPLILNRPTPLDLSYSGLEEFKQPEVNEYGPRDSSLKPTIGCDKESNNSKENTDDSLEQHQKTDTETSSVKSSLKVDKDWKEKFFCPANHVREVELKKVRENNDAPIIEDWVSDDEDDDEPNPKVENKSVIPTATKKEIYMHVNTVRSVNTGRPFSTARSFNTIRPSYTAHPKSTVHCAKPRTYFQDQAQSTVHRPFYKRTSLTKRCYNQRFNTGRQNVNTVRARGFNVVKPSACWVWRPIKPNGASLQFTSYNDKGFVDSGMLKHTDWKHRPSSDLKTLMEVMLLLVEEHMEAELLAKMCDKKNYVLFTDSEFLIMKNISPKDSLTYLVAKATSEESMLWHRRLGHINFKNINKLVKENLVRDLPLKRFENDQTCVACLKGKQHRASYKTKAFNPITKPFFMLHMDLFSLQLSERKNRTLIEAARTMLADSKLPTTFWAKAVSTACYIILGNAQFMIKDRVQDEDDAYRKSLLMIAFLRIREEPKRVPKALSDPAWVEAMQEELLQFKLQKVWILVDLPKVIEQLVHKIEAIRLYMAYASYIGDSMVSNGCKKVAFRIWHPELGMTLWPTISCAMVFKEGPSEKEKEFLSVKINIVHEILRKYNSLMTWILRTSPGQLVAYTDNDMLGATQDRKVNTSGCIFGK